nr:MAG TPA: hypothetical protein [Caudoviricetes sp.]
MLLLRTLHQGKQFKTLIKNARLLIQLLILQVNI